MKIWKNIISFERYYISFIKINNEKINIKQCEFCTKNWINPYSNYDLIERMLNPLDKINHGTKEDTNQPRNHPLISSDPYG